jgi:hypothetical protein
MKTLEDKVATVTGGAALCLANDASEFISGVELAVAGARTV